MNENLNLVEILNGCPKGMELDCTMFDNVTFAGVVENRVFPIRIIVGGGTTMVLTKYGQYTDDDFAKCVIFPKGETTWEGFVPPHKFKDGDILSYQNARLSNRTIYIYRYHKRFNTSYYVSLSFDPKKSLIICDKGDLALCTYDLTVRFATEEEKQKLFKAIKDNGYEWNAETKTLKKLVKPKFKVGDKLVNRINMYMGDLSHQCVISEITEDKYILNDGGYISIKNQDIWELATDKKDRFDLKTLQPFDKVLVKVGSYWRIELFSHMYEYKGDIYYACVMSSYKECIPYNDETKCLVNTSEEAPKFYRNWEDW